jgi:hypothetical protein
VERFIFLGVPMYVRNLVRCAMLYPWPLHSADQVVLSDALEIAMDYLEATGQAVSYPEVQHKVADAIVRAWRAGMRHQIRLANSGILAIERETPRGQQHSFYPRIA